MPTPSEWRDLGAIPFVAEAFAGRELPSNQVRNMMAEEMLDEVFSWHGIIGFTDQILAAVDCCRKLEEQL